MKTILIIATLFYLGASFELSDVAFLPHVKMVNDAVESFTRQTRQAGGRPDLEQIIRVLWAVGDTDGNGLISKSELSSFLSTYSKISVQSANDISNIFVTFGDKNGDGELSRQEYRDVSTLVGGQA